MYNKKWPFVVLPKRKQANVVVVVVVTEHVT